MPKLSAISAACGPYWMSCTISDTTMAISTRAASLVLSSPKYGKAKIAVPAMPIAYVFRRPIRSEMCPNSGTVINPTAAATSV